MKTFLLSQSFILAVAFITHRVALIKKKKMLTIPSFATVPQY